ncbi:peroxisomal biogenesis factor 3-like [Paramacrobiotus metropolitanus]|uniref:peroxisomal biogenesis factor 3-like n=1 Tax=Paramacrobiotus metropolitanus TaxID=2943436 RepID=UPI002445C21E|nr:peroxisomal biogenesis factor 3-like [Paramacrobiotus metropolitanus]
MTDEDKSLIGKAYDFWKRHKRKAIVLGGISGAVYLYNNSEEVRDVVDQTWNWIAQKLPIPAQIFPHPDEARSKVGRNRLRPGGVILHEEHSSAGECHSATSIADSQSIVATCIQLLQMAGKNLDGTLSTEALRLEISKNPANKMELWEEMKIVSWSRCFASLYTVCHLVMYLQIQTGVAGRFLCIQNAESSRDLNRKLQIISHHVQCAEFPVNEGFGRMMKVTRDVVSKVVAFRGLQDFLSLNDIRQIISDVRKIMEDGVGDEGYRRYHNYHLEFLVPEAQLDSSIDREPLEHSCESAALLSLTNDVNAALQSVDCSMILNCCLEYSFTRFIAEIKSFVDDRARKTNAKESARIPHAALLPAVSRISNLYIKPPEAEPLIKELVDIQYFRPFVERIVSQSLQLNSVVTN